MALERDSPPLEEPLAKLELALIDEFLRARGYDPVVLRSRSDGAAKAALKDATIYAATRLTEVESRAHYIHEIHGGSDRKR
jgi:hypothetical protein